MRLVSFDRATATAEVRWMWLPMFIAQNIPMMKQLELDLTNKYSKAVADDETLNAMHVYVLEWLDQKFRLPGLRQYLSGVVHVQE